MPRLYKIYWTAQLTIHFFKWLTILTLSCSGEEARCFHRQQSRKSQCTEPVLAFGYGKKILGRILENHKKSYDIVVQ